MHIIGCYSIISFMRKRINYKKIKISVKLYNKKMKEIKKKYISIRIKNELKQDYLATYLCVRKSFIKRIIYYKFLYSYKNIDTIVDNYNNEYLLLEDKINEKFFNNIGGFPLDLNQRMAVLKDEDNSLVIAGAGSGKSLTIIGKIHYLIQKQYIKENDILCISFTNEATKSLKQKLKKLYGYNIDVMTFHKLGLEIIKNNDKKYKITKNELEKIVDEYFRNLNKKDIICVMKYLNEFVEIKGYYKIETYKTLREISIGLTDNIKTKEEKEIANILYLMEIDYSYIETSFGGIFKIKGDCIYYYHFKNPLYALMCIDKNKKYKSLYKCMIYYDGFYIALKHLLGREIMTSSYEKIYMDMLYNNNDYLTSLKNLLVNFINIYKSSGKSINEIEVKIKKNTVNYYFFYIFKKVYFLYQEALNNNNLLDVNDLLIKAIELTSNNYNYKMYKYIIIDEFQDTSMVRYSLIHNIIKETNAKLVAVGDDFQSIYRFSGCDIALFINFSTYFPNASLSYINNTYRNSQELINVAGSFVMKNPNQIKKQLKANKHVHKPIEICYYDDLSTELYKINRNLSTGKSKIILGRNNKDIHLLNSSVFGVNKNNVIDKKYKEVIPYLTVHKSKGLEFDYVFLINVSDSIDGFPSKISGHEILNLVLPKNDSFPFAEERRLFYVALTRAKIKVFIMSPRGNPSIFVKEIEEMLNKK